MTEIWKNNLEYPGYLFSSLGRIKLKSGRITNKKVRSDGYIRSSFYNKDGNIVNKLFHVIIAETFIESIPNKKFVNHINGIRHDNKISNLEWVSSSENNNKKIFPKNAKKERKIVQYSLNVDLIKVWSSIKEASIYLNISKGNLSSGCKENRIRGGYRWKYYDDIQETNEIWKPVKIENKMLEVSSNGRCKLPSGMLTFGSLSSSGYMKININNSGYLIHRIICQTFFPIDNSNLLVVNHKDGIKTNNFVDNLEWMNNSENRLHASNLDRVKIIHLRKIAKKNKNGEIIEIFKSLQEANEKTNISKGNISSVCSGKRKFAGGFLWEYLE